MKDDREPQKKISTCLDDALSAKMMRKIMGQKGIGSLSEEMMRSLTGKPHPNRGERQEKTNPEVHQFRRHKMIESLMNFHKCSNCSIRCRASRKPRSLFARIHRWHATWWPGWKLYQAELGARRAKGMSRV